MSLTALSRRSLLTMLITSLFLLSGCLEPIDLSDLVITDTGGSSKDSASDPMDAGFDAEPTGPDGESDVGGPEIPDGGSRDVIDSDGTDQADVDPFGSGDGTLSDSAVDAAPGPMPPRMECGDGILAENEVCDDANLLSGDGCDENCDRETCQAYASKGRLPLTAEDRPKSIVLDESTGSFAILMEDHVQVEGGDGLVKWNDFTIDANIFGRMPQGGGEPEFAGVSQMAKSSDGLVVTSAEIPFALLKRAQQDGCVFVYELASERMHPRGRLEKPVVHFGEAPDSHHAIIGYGHELFSISLGGADGAVCPLGRDGEEMQPVERRATLLTSDLDGLEIGGEIIRLVAADIDDDGAEELVALSTNGNVYFIEINILDNGGLQLSEVSSTSGPYRAGVDPLSLDMVVVNVIDDQVRRHPLGRPTVAILHPSMMNGRAKISTLRLRACGPDVCEREACDPICVECCRPEGELWVDYELNFAADHLAAGDVDGDGLADLAAVGGTDGECTGSLGVLLQSGMSPPFVPRQWDPRRQGSPLSDLVVGTAPAGVLVADVRRSAAYDAQEGVVRPQRAEIIVVNAGNQGADVACDQRHVEMISHEIAFDPNQDGHGDSCNVDFPCGGGLGGPRCRDFVYADVAAGAYHNCGVIPGRQGLRCWGAYELDSDILAVPVIDMAEQFFKVAAAVDRTCAITQVNAGLEPNRVRCWPDGAWRVGDASAYSEVSLGASFVCGINAVGQGLNCLGSAGHNPTGNDQQGAYGTPWVMPQPNAVQRRVTSISVANNHACWIVDGTEMGCWGNQFDMSNLEATAIPLDLNNQPKPFRSVSVASYQGAGESGGYTCGIGLDDVAVCWGAGIGDFTPPANVKFHSISAGDGSVCGVATDGRAHCWGAHRDLALFVPPGLFKFVSLGSGHACGLTQMGTVRCWGTGGPPHDEICDDSGMVACSELRDAEHPDRNHEPHPNP